MWDLSGVISSALRHGIRAQKPRRASLPLPSCEDPAEGWLKENVGFTRHRSCQHLDLGLSRLQNALLLLIAAAQMD